MSSALVAKVLGGKESQTQSILIERKGRRKHGSTGVHDGTVWQRNGTSDKGFRPCGVLSSFRAFCYCTSARQQLQEVSPMATSVRVTGPVISESCGDFG